ncbi:hypothetical protein Pan54_51200 [Rubinisphaera italica]|uniref:Uncharacterized protein n=1 Tax=Rubinisphaera italica TaxID=2527969 RepID=A0A5C5XNR4_9PLAN|nr:hypothetical protein Pan54_51200 [Rubinisphaera italica]
MLVIAVASEFFTWRTTLVIMVMFTVRAVVLRFSRSHNSQPRLMRITGVGMVRTTSQYRVKRDCRRRQDGDDAVKHSFVEMLVLPNSYLYSLYRLFGISSTAIYSDL